MICQKCKTEGVFVQGLTFQFYYCRTCKTEIDLEIVGRKKEIILEPKNDSDLNPYLFYYGEIDEFRN